MNPTPSVNNRARRVLFIVTMKSFWGGYDMANAKLCHMWQPSWWKRDLLKEVDIGPSFSVIGRKEHGVVEILG